MDLRPDIVDTLALLAVRDREMGGDNSVFVIDSPAVGELEALGLARANAQVVSLTAEGWWEVCARIGDRRLEAAHRVIAAARATGRGGS